MVGSAHALDLLLSGRVVGSEEAAQIGIVNRTITSDRLLAESANYVKGLAERSAPVSMKVIKQQVYRHLSTSLGEAARESIELMAESLKRPDFREGVSSYIEKTTTEIYPTLFRNSRKQIEPTRSVITGTGFS